MAESSYFPHDSNARNDDKIIRLRMRHKACGYGIYFMLLERMRESPDYMCVRDYNILAFDLREDTSTIKSVVEDFGLFSFTDDGRFYSESFRRRMEVKDEKSRKRAEAGKKGMEARWKNRTEKEAPPVKAEPPLPSAELCETGLEECFNELSGNGSWKEVVVMNTRNSGFKDFTPDAFDAKLAAFFAKLGNEGVRTKSPADAQSHFARWLKIELKNEENRRIDTGSKQEANQYAVQRFADRVAAAEQGVYDNAPKPF